MEKIFIYFRRNLWIFQRIYLYGQLQIHKLLSYASWFSSFLIRTALLVLSSADFPTQFSPSLPRLPRVLQSQPKHSFQFGHNDFIFNEEQLRRFKLRSFLQHPFPLLPPTPQVQVFSSALYPRHHRFPAVYYGVYANRHTTFHTDIGK